MCWISEEYLSEINNSLETGLEESDKEVIFEFVRSVSRLVYEDSLEATDIGQDFTIKLAVQIMRCKRTIDILERLYDDLGFCFDDRELIEYAESQLEFAKNNLNSAIEFLEKLQENAVKSKEFDQLQSVKLRQKLGIN